MNSDFIVAVHALVYLNHKADIVSSEALAKNICTNAARVRKVMAPLKLAQISIADIDDRIFGSDGVVPFDGRPASSGAEG